MTFGQHCATLAAEKGFCTGEHRAPFAALVDREIKGWATSDDAQNLVDLGRRGKKIPPTFEEVASYIIEINAQVDAAAFIDCYQANGWTVGKGKKMKDWCAAVRNWKREGWGKKVENTKPESGKAEKKLTEWERKQKVERLCKLRDELQDIYYPGGCAYPVAVQGENKSKVTRIKADINEVQLELLAK